MDEIFSTYSKMGVKGFKIDFMDRDDQNMVQFYYRVAKNAAGHHIMVDFHGAYKPTGLLRTYPNVVNVEGVHGMEQLKWSNPDMPGFDVSIPFIRMIAGPMDYTPGAMRNATKQAFRPINSMPMSQGTRCHQLAMYVMYEAPFEMLSDNPTAYMRETESVNFISSIPTTFDETIALDGKLGEYAAIARRKNDTWYIGAMNNWNAKDLVLELSFLKEGNYEAEIFQDGINADRDATDYKRKIVKITSGQKWSIHLSNGGGWAAKIYPVK
jgi:alpha-glucosidase